MAFYSEIGKMFRKPPGVPSVPPPEIYDIWDEGDGLSAEPGVPGIDDEEEDLPPYHTYYQFIRPPPVDEIELPKGEMDEENSADKDDDDSMDDDSSDKEQGEAAKPAPTEPLRPTSLQARMLAIAGQDVNSVIQEMDYLRRQKEFNKQATFETRKARMESGDFDDENPMDTGNYPPQMAPPPLFARPPMMAPYPMGPPPSAYGGYGPPIPGGPRLPPGPPPRMPPGMAPRMIRPPGMPPPPPPGKPFYLLEKLSLLIYYSIQQDSAREHRLCSVQDRRVTLARLVSRLLRSPRHQSSRLSRKCVT